MNLITQYGLHVLVSVLGLGWFYIAETGGASFYVPGAYTTEEQFAQRLGGTNRDGLLS